MSNSAFPFNATDQYKGLTKRQYIATAIAAAVIANPEETKDNRTASLKEVVDVTVEVAYMVADRILERE